MQRVAHLLGVPVQSLIDALTRKTIFAHGETVVSKELFHNAKYRIAIIREKYFFPN